jgi:indolepyruvate ferredoxin oxidoreductase beta subunit
VQSDLRLSTDPIFSDQIPLGGADLILSMEPMEALRYLPYLGPEGAVVTSSKPFVNIPNYPDEAALLQELGALPKVTQMDIDAVAKELLAPRSANMVLLGMAARHLSILSADDLRTAIRTIFGRKGEKVVEDNLKAFDAGYEGIQ